MMVPVDTAAGFSRRTPEVLFEYPSAFAAFGRTYDISPDGDRFLVVKASSPTGDADGGAEITVVFNWFEELKRLVPIP